VSDSLPAKVALRMAELTRLLAEFAPLLAKGAQLSLDTIETAAAASMLHSFYTEIEQILKLVGAEVNHSLPSGEFWHRDLLVQLTQPGDSRGPVISADLAERLKEYLAFRHVFRGASVALMRWEKMKPLALDAEMTFRRFKAELDAFLAHRAYTSPESLE
jgi:hypothetical protein